VLFVGRLIILNVRMSLGIYLLGVRLKRERFDRTVVGFAEGSDFVAEVGNFVSDGRRFAPGLGN